jgi:hypothetical protein
MGGGGSTGWGNDRKGPAFIVMPGLGGSTVWSNSPDPPTFHPPISACLKAMYKQVQLAGALLSATSSTSGD